MGRVSSASEGALAPAWPYSWTEWSARGEPSSSDGTAEHAGVNSFAMRPDGHLRSSPGPLGPGLGLRPTQTTSQRGGGRDRQGGGGDPRTITHTQNHTNTHTHTRPRTIRSHFGSSHLRPSQSLSWNTCCVSGVPRLSVDLAHEGVGQATGDVVWQGDPASVAGDAEAGGEEEDGGGGEEEEGGAAQARKPAAFDSGAGEKRSQAPDATIYSAAISAQVREEGAAAVTCDLVGRYAAPLAEKNTRAHAHTHTHKHTHTRARKYTHTNTRALTHTHTHRHTHARIHTHTRTHARTHARTHTRAHTRTRTRIHQ